jgi:hypothetical protein
MPLTLVVANFRDRETKILTLLLAAGASAAAIALPRLLLPSRRPVPTQTALRVKW